MYEKDELESMNKSQDKALKDHSFEIIIFKFKVEELSAKVNGMEESLEESQLT